MQIKREDKRNPSKHAISFEGVPSMTKQSFRDGTKVDRILKKYAAQGISPDNVGLFQRSVANMEFGVADTTYDYQTQLNKINEVKEYFAALPSRIREKFRNDPARMLRFMSDPANMDECVKLGLFRGPEKEKKADPAPAAPPAAPPGAASAPNKAPAGGAAQ